MQVASAKVMINCIHAFSFYREALTVAQVVVEVAVEHLLATAGVAHSSFATPVAQYPFDEVSPQPG